MILIGAPLSWLILILIRNSRVEHLWYTHTSRSKIPICLNSKKSWRENSLQVLLGIVNRRQGLDWWPRFKKPHIATNISFSFLKKGGKNSIPLNWAHEEDCGKQTVRWSMIKEGEMWMPKCCQQHSWKISNWKGGDIPNLASSQSHPLYLHYLRIFSRRLYH